MTTSARSSTRTTRRRDAKTRPAHVRNAAKKRKRGVKECTVRVSEGRHVDSGATLTEAWPLVNRPSPGRILRTYRLTGRCCYQLADSRPISTVHSPQTGPGCVKSRCTNLGTPPPPPHTPPPPKKELEQSNGFKFH